MAITTPVATKAAFTGPVARCTPCTRAGKYMPVIGTSPGASPPAWPCCQLKTYGLVFPLPKSVPVSIDPESEPGCSFHPCESKSGDGCRIGLDGVANDGAMLGGGPPKRPPPKMPA